MFKHTSLFKYMLALLLTLLTQQACKDADFLDVEPAFLTEENYFLNEEEFERSVRGVYAKMTDWYWFGNNSPLSPMWQLPGDDLTTLGDMPHEIFATLNSGEDRLSRYYKSTYELINRANVVLEKNAPSTVYKDLSLKNYHRGEALFLRGLAYYNLWNLFGTSPLVTERTKTIEQSTSPGTSGTQLLDQAISDFAEAATLLPAAWNDLNRGRATKNAALGFQAKALVFRASWNNANADYAAALQAIGQLQNLSLMASFEDNFDPNTENNAESLFEFQASQPGFDNVWLPNDFGAPVGSMSAYWGFYENHWSLFGAPPIVATQKLKNAFETEDPRKAVTMDADGNIRKYVSKDVKTQSGVASVNNPRILRYADVLLLKAEALVRSGGSVSEALALVNQVRARARNMVPGGLVPADRPASADAAQVMTWIMEERMIELAGEESRWFDLRRWHKAGLLLLNTAFFNSINSKISFDPGTHLLFPIPNNEIDLNPNVSQNPGY
ncbi:MAG: RagB/SusD family nutrient uptake outer membrane protein [Bacteroidia bacterium]|nr:RagB/SusD family nutrient uptake outer membrane protein [Bacteroidia bacterium]